jgi:tetratricopeptide (TPR) repeat protein
MASELSDDLYQRIVALSEAGDALAADGAYADALKKYNEAWSLVPAPQQQWEASTWLLAASADAHFFLGNYAKMIPSLNFATTCPDGLGNPFIHLRLGQACFETGDLDRAADELMRAYMGDGEDAFAQEDPKYLAFLRTRAQL